MSSFIIQFTVESDSKSPKFVSIINSSADSLKQLVEDHYPRYVRVLRHIWKAREGDIRMEPLPNRLLKVKGFWNGEQMRSDDILQAFYEKRKQTWLENVASKFQHMCGSKNINRG